MSKVSLDVIARLAVPLKVIPGRGTDPESGLCLMQLVDYFGGSTATFSDDPAGVSPILAAVGRSLNDGAPNQTARDGLKEFIWPLIGSHDAKAELRRELVLSAGLEDAKALADEQDPNWWPVLKDAFRSAILAGTHGQSDLPAMSPRTSIAAQVLVSG